MVSLLKSLFNSNCLGVTETPIHIARLAMAILSMP